MQQGLVQQIKCTLSNKRLCMTYPLDGPLAQHFTPKTDPRQDNSNWLQMWREGQTQEFHQALVNPLLTRFWHNQTFKKQSRVLVPLCGKSLDMLWLASQGHRVIGVELSPIAVKDFFDENELKVKKTRQGNFVRWQSGAIAIWCGDFFSLKQSQLGQIDNVFDRASLSALPENIRSIYVAQLRSLIGREADVFLLTVEEIVKGSAQSVGEIDEEIIALYSEHFDIQLTHSQRAEHEFGMENKVYRMNPFL